jgi:hypothetical protein
MIRPLRQRHRHFVIALGIFLPVAFAVGIAARRAVPEVNSLPKELAPAVAQFEAQEWQRADLFTKSPVQVRLMREHSGAGKFAVEFSAAKDFVKPDLIVYWVAGNPTITDKLPDNAILLGSFSSTPLLLLDEITKSTGQLVLFSLADNEIVDVSKTIRFNDSTK